MTLLQRIKNAVQKFTKSEPSLTVGSITSAVGVLLTWVQTNKITSWRQAVTVAAPIVLSWVIRNFVTPNATANNYLSQLKAIQWAATANKVAPAPVLPPVTPAP